MKAQDKPKYVAELRDIISRLNPERLINKPDDGLVDLGVMRAKAIFTSFDSNMGSHLEYLVKTFLEVARAGRREEHIRNLARDIRNYVVQKTEEMDVYIIDPIEVEDRIKGEDEIVENPNTNQPSPSNADIYDVALSFASEKRDYVYKVAKKLEENGITVFYDDFPEQELDMWGKNLRDYLTGIFAGRAKYCVMFISAEYSQKTWPDFERQIIQARSMIDEDMLLPARFDKTPIKGEIPTIKYIDISSMSPQKFADMITKKIMASKSTESSSHKAIESEAEPPTGSRQEQPVLYVDPSIRRSGGPTGHFIYFTIKNVSREAALDIRWGIRGFAYEWRPTDTELFELDPLKEKEVVYPISNESPFLKEIPELNIFIEYGDTRGNIFFSRRELQQVTVPSGAFHELKAGGFHSPVLLQNDNVNFESGPMWNGNRVDMTFTVKQGNLDKAITISISRTLLSVWGFTDIDEIKHALLELGFRKIRTMIKENNLDDYLFVTSNFPKEMQNGLKGYQLLRDSL